MADREAESSGRRDAVSLAVSVPLAQPPAGFDEDVTAARVDGTGWGGAPATIVSPAIATDQPSRSDRAPSEAVSLAVCVPLAHPPAGLTNT